jgi:NAD(P)-dependent dehydrogenase (short-subunit alcohol dehydrogenase family)
MGRQGGSLRTVKPTSRHHFSKSAVELIESRAPALIDDGSDIECRRGSKIQLSAEQPIFKIEVMKEFDGKAALLTGGGSGIGRATAVAFAREGAKVVIADRNAQRGEEIVSTIRDAGGIASFRRTDVSVAAEIEALVDYTMKTYGRLDLAFNNAGIEGDVKPLVDQTEANFDAVMDINVKGVWLSMKYEIPRMLEQGGGAIVNSSSVAGVTGFPGIGIYAASKHAVIGLTKTAALEYSAQGIRINAVNPAAIDTEMIDRLADGLNTKKNDLSNLHPIGRIGRVEEVAEAVLWLCSDRASFVTGHSLMVDGGFTAR